MHAKEKILKTTKIRILNHTPIRNNTSNRCEYLEDGKNKIEEVAMKSEEKAQELIKENAVVNTYQVDTIENTVLDKLIKLHMRKNHKDAERSKNNEVEGTTKNVLAKELEEKLKR